MIFITIKRFVFLFFVLSVIYTIWLKFFPVAVTPLMLYRLVDAIREKRTVIYRYDWKPYPMISPHLQLSVIAAEDQRFLEHYGFDFEAIKRVIQTKAKRGASTISQQTAKNIFLLPATTKLRKIIEAYFTVLIELIWGKKRIMTIYLNVIEMGNGIYGCEAAAGYYFGVSAHKLTVHQSAQIAGCLPNPFRYSPYNNPKTSHILQQMSYFPPDYLKQMD